MRAIPFFFHMFLIMIICFFIHPVIGGIAFGYMTGYSIGGFWILKKLNNDGIPIEVLKKPFLHKDKK